MKFKQLESELTKLSSFLKPKVDLEQYPTSPDVAIRVLMIANEYGDIKNKVVVDLGCGCGVLSYAAYLFDCFLNVMVDIDQEALELARKNVEFGEFFLCDALKFDYVADTVIMNPPFGTRNKGVDIKFIEKALEIAPIVYSMHKTTTRSFIQKRFNAKLIAEVKFPIKKIFKFHQNKQKDVYVDVFRITK